MGKRGPQPKPVELKKALGNPGKRPLPEPVTVLAPSVPAEARPGDMDGRQALQYVLDRGAAAWISDTDLQADVLIALWDDWNLARARWKESGDDGAFKAYDALTKQLNVCLGRLGLNPTDRGALGLAQVVQARQGLAAIREARASKAGRRAS